MLRGDPRAQHGQRGSIRAIATTIAQWTVAIELGTWRWGRSDGAAGLVTAEMAGFANNPAERGAEGESSLARKYFHRSEHWVVVRGVAEVTISEDVRLYHENESPTCRSAGSTGSTIQARIPLELNGVQVGSYLGEDDILRLKDVDCRYARA